jgi:CBS domain-containing protein
LARVEDVAFWRPSTLLVEEFMTTDLFTARKDDLIEFAANLLDWRRIRYIPIEDDQKHLVGLVSMRMVLREYSKIIHENNEHNSSTIEKIMINNPITVHPEASIIEAMEIMQDQQIGCLPVVKNSRLVGIITEGNYINISRRLIKALASEKKEKDS